MPPEQKGIPSPLVGPRALSACLPRLLGRRSSNVAYSGGGGAGSLWWGEIRLILAIRGPLSAAALVRWVGAIARRALGLNGGIGAKRHWDACKREAHDSLPSDAWNAGFGIGSPLKNVAIWAVDLH